MPSAALALKTPRITTSHLRSASVSGTRLPTAALPSATGWLADSFGAGGISWRAATPAPTPGPGPAPTPATPAGTAPSRTGRGGCSRWRRSAVPPPGRCSDVPDAVEQKRLQPVLGERAHLPGGRGLARREPAVGEVGVRVARNCTSHEVIFAHHQPVGARFNDRARSHSRLWAGSRRSGPHFSRGLPRPPPTHTLRCRIPGYSRTALPSSHPWSVGSVRS
jgi:hypothetical protein